MSTSIPPERFHALDPTRAFALLLGVVFHAAWSYVKLRRSAHFRASGWSKRRNAVTVLTFKSITGGGSP